jgi:hypothetical protein
MVNDTEMNMLGKNPKPFFISMGNAMNMVIEGAMSHTILLENSTAVSLLCVSIYIHVMANMETNGIAASNAPIKLYLLPISEISTIKSDVMISLVM